MLRVFVKVVNSPKNSFSVKTHTPQPVELTQDYNTGSNTHLISFLSVNIFKSFLLHLGYKRFIVDLMMHELLSSHEVEFLVY